MIINLCPKTIMDTQMSLVLKLWIASGLVMANAMAAVADSSLATHTPVCFMQTENGQIVDLSRLCRTTDEQVTTPQPAQPVVHQRRGRGAARRR